jgi:hypothetical protein
MFFNEYPYRNLTDLNLDYILKQIRELTKEITDFVSLNSIKYANPIQWDITTQYEKNTVVIDGNTGTAYISVKPVPNGVNLANTDYWTVVFTLDILASNHNITTRDDGGHVTATFPSNKGDWLLWNAILYKAIRPIVVYESYVEGYNITRFTVDDFVHEYVNTLAALIGDLDDLNTTDKTSLVNALNELVATIGALTDLNTTDKTNIVNAINEVLAGVGDLTDLNTTDKTNLVNAINEVLQALTDTTGDLTELNTTDKTNLVNAINEVLQTLTDTTGDLADLNTTNKSSLVGAINEVLSSSPSVIDKLPNRKFILIGDSYATGVNVNDPSNPITAYYEYFAQYAGIPASNFVISAANGYGFARPTYTFLSLLQNVSVSDPLKITDIVVCGGPNDTPDAIYPNVVSAIRTFVEYCKTTYPNARVYIGMIGHNYVGSNSNYRLNRVFNLYLQGANENGAYYLNNIENVLHYNDCFKSDGHPSPTGQKLLGRSLLNAIATGFATIYPQNQLQNAVTLDSAWVDQSITTIFTSQHDNVIEIVNNQFINLTLSSDISITNREYSDYIKIGHLSNSHVIGGDFTFTRWCAPICMYLTSGTNTGGIGEYYITDGDLYVRVYNTLKQNYVLHGLRICPFAATFPAKLC